MEDHIFEVVWPRGRRTTEDVHLARRLDTLAGKTVCELWDWLFNAKAMFPAIEKELAKRYPGVKFVGYEAFGSMHGADEPGRLAALPDKLRQHKCDAILSGIGC